MVGLSYHWDEAVRAAGRKPADDEWVEKTVAVTLVREPENSHDRNAVAVYSKKGEMFGYVNRSDASELGPTLDRLFTALGGVVEVRARCDLEVTWDTDWDDDDNPVGPSEVIEIDAAIRLSNPATVNVVEPD